MKSQWGRDFSPIMIVVDTRVCVCYACNFLDFRSMASFSNAMIGVPEKTRNLEEMKLFDDYCHHVTTLKLHTFAPYSQPATKLALKLDASQCSLKPPTKITSTEFQSRTRLLLLI